ncbi:MAG: hypothetical protein Q4C37_09570 [Bacteroidales bacterium]|nr:hypothetical protein [Bacteroidales bacterium]
MNNEETRLLNEDIVTQGQSKSDQSASTVSRKSARKGNAVAAGAGGFVAGAAVGAAATAAASPSDTELPEEVEEIKAETVETPEPDQVILANDEGIRYAHVDAGNFSDAFAQARAQVGPGGVFEYNGKIYATYTAEEWNGMSQQERVDFQSHVYDVAPSRQPSPSNTDHAQTEAELSEPAPEVLAVNEEMIDVEPVDNEIRVLGVETVQDDYGNIMNVALVECGGDQAILLDIDNDGTIDVLLHDDNVDGCLQESEIHDVSGANLQVADLMQAHVAQEGDMLYASNDTMPDYVNDADFTMNA